MSKGTLVGLTHDEFTTWLETQPPQIQELGRRYPPGIYKIKPGAPYPISCPGTIVHFFSYHLDGSMSMVVPAENKLPEALLYEQKVAFQNGINKHKIKAIIKADILVQIDPTWMEPAAYKCQPGGKRITPVSNG